MFILDLVRNFFTYSLCFITILVCAVPVLILVYLPFSWGWVSVSFYKIIHTVHWLFLSFTFLPLSLNFPEKPLPEVGIFVANHQSSLDIFMMGRVLKDRKYSMLAKGELTEYPLLGTLVEKVGIPVYYGDCPKRGLALPCALDKLKNNISVGLFPEAERFVDGYVHQFKTGFAVMAKESGKPVIPVYLEGSGKALPPSHKMIQWHPLTITVGSPFYYKEGETIQEFVGRVREWFIQEGKNKVK
ncbi:1-acyl-sn-glycerol-3-phosphate acyltransferase [Candidatus Babeliales bacterium]|nr:1-acyl-sn-glycerol-3-phosphate acyltransferase [Candidatus Babeliales bacterium]